MMNYIGHISSLHATNRDYLRPAMINRYLMTLSLEYHNCQASVAVRTVFLRDLAELIHVRLTHEIAFFTFFADNWGASYMCNYTVHNDT